MIWTILKAWLVALLAKLGAETQPTVDSALALFNKAKDKLEAAVDFHHAEIEAQEAAERLAIEAKAWAAKQKAQAQRALGKIEEFLGLEE